MRSSSTSRFARLAPPAPPVQDSSPASAPIDLAHLGRYTLGDKGLEREVLGLFLAHMPLTIESMRFAASERDWHVAAHTLKGSARAVGAHEIAGLAVAAEKLGGPADATGASELLARLDGAVEVLRDWTEQTFPPA